MQAFSGAILGREHDTVLPTVAYIEGESLLLSSPEGPVGEWPLDQVKIVEVGNGYFEVVAEGRRLSLVVDEPAAFEEALVAERTQRTTVTELRPDPLGDHQVSPKAKSRHSARPGPRFEGSGFLLRRPRHGRARVRTLPFLVSAGVVTILGYLAGSVFGDMVNIATTESPRIARTTPAEVVVRALDGSGDRTSSSFGVIAPWEVHWSFEGPEDALLEVLLVSKDGATRSLALQEGPGSGEVPLTEAGVFRLELRSSGGGEWSVRVVEVAEAGSG